MSKSGNLVDLHFLVPGFSKCGTTTLCALLAEHPSLHVPMRPLKEPWFFSHHFDNGWDSYAAFFADAKPGALLGEGSTSYASFDSETKARERILAHYPQIKLIFIARDPIDRIESSFRQFHHNGAGYGLDCPFELEAAIETIPALIEDTKYWTRIQNYRRYLADDQVLVVLLEDLKLDPHAVLVRCFEFLGVDPNVKISRIDRRENAGERMLQDTPELREMRNAKWRPEMAIPLSRIPVEIQDQFLEKLGLRKPFGTARPKWTDAARRSALDAFAEDASRFLKHFGRDVSVWPRFSAALAEAGRQSDPVSP